MGISIPLYSVYARSEKNSKLHPRDVLGGMTPDRQAEYDFVLRNLLSLDIKAKILDVGCSSWLSPVRSQSLVEIDVKLLVLT